VATLVRPRGIKGEVVAEPGAWSASDLMGFRKLIMHPGEREVELESAWPHRDRLILKLRGIDTVEQAEALRGAELRIPAEDRPAAPEGEYYLSDLTGCCVVEMGTGAELGVVTDCLEYGGPLLLEVKQGAKEMLIPFAAAVCREVDVRGKRILVELPEGLKEL
jgi:16S rRNA processing protein RimM